MTSEISAIRTRVALARKGASAVVAVRGEDARDALLHLLPSRLHLRDAQARESLLLSEDGRPIADVLVCADDEDYMLFVDGLDQEALSRHFETHLPAKLSPKIEDLSSTYDVLSLHGPWAWELVAHVLGSDLVVLPYLSFFRIDQGFCLRAGTTGEYGYDLLVRRETTEALAAEILSKGEPWGIAEVGDEALSLCRFENWFFDPRHVPADATPIELQLQWRLDSSRSWLGKEAVDARRATEPQRVTCLVSASPIEAGEIVRFGDRSIGTIVRSAYSPTREEHVASALLDRAYAHGAIDRYEVGERAIRVRTVAPPLIYNHSLSIDPRRHSYREVDEIAFPPLGRGPRAPGGAA